MLVAPELSSKPVAHRCCLLAIGRWDGRTESTYIGLPQCGLRQLSIRVKHWFLLVDSAKLQWIEDSRARIWYVSRQKMTGTCSSCLEKFAIFAVIGCRFQCFVQLSSLFVPRRPPVISRLSLVFFYHAMLCMRGTSHGPLTVCPCLSVTSRCSTKTDKRRMT